MKKRMCLFFVIFIFMVEIVVSCKNNDKKYDGSTETGHMMSLTFPVNITTGYDWAFEYLYSDENNMGQVTEVNEEYINDNSGLLGSPIKKRYSFRADAKGKVTLLFKYMRNSDENQIEYTVEYDFDISDINYLTCVDRRIHNINGKADKNEIPFPNFEEVE